MCQTEPLSGSDTLAATITAVLSESGDHYLVGACTRGVKAVLGVTIRYTNEALGTLYKKNDTKNIREKLKEFAGECSICRVFGLEALEASFSINTKPPYS